MNNFHPDFPFGRGMWIWYISRCEGGNIDAIIQKCKDYGLSYVLIKSGDGRNLWQQFSKALVDRFHTAGIKVYSWTYNYGADPIREGDIACWSLDQGADGHVFNAEAEWRDLPQPAAAAVSMLERVRKQFPNKFLAHAPFAIIDNHRRFPYAEFGKYCDAVMPQVYYGMFKKSPAEAMGWMFDNWLRWENEMKNSGRADSVTPIIPIGQAYDHPPFNFVVSPQSMKEFIDASFGYQSVSFWEWSHMDRKDCWEAIRDNNVKAPAGNEPIVIPKPQGAPTPPPPVVEFSERDKALIDSLRVSHPGYAGWPDREMLANFKDGGGDDKLPKLEQTPGVINQPELADSGSPSIPQGSVPIPEAKPNDTQNLPVNTPVEIPMPQKTGDTTIVELTKTADGVQTHVRVGKTHLDIFLSIIDGILKLLRIRK